MTDGQLLTFANALLNEAQEQNNRATLDLPPEVFSARMSASLVLSGISGALLQALREPPTRSVDSRRQA